MDGLLTPMKTTMSGVEKSDNDDIKPSQNVPPESVEDVLAAINGKPDLDVLRNTLKWLGSGSKDLDRRVLDIGPKSAEVKFAFLNKIIPDFWPLLCKSPVPEHKKVKILLLQFFSDVAGVAFLASHCRLALSTFKSSSSKNERKALAQSLDTSLSFTAQLLKPQSSLYRHWQKLHNSSLNASQRALSLKEYASILPSGRILSLAAEAQKLASEDELQQSDGPWLADGRKYSLWLGNNLSFMLHEIGSGDSDAWEALKLMLSKSLTLGYNSKSLVHEANSTLRRYR